MECLLPFSLDWCKAAITPLKLRAELQKERTPSLYALVHVKLQFMWYTNIYYFTGERGYGEKQNHSIPWETFLD